MKLSFGLIILAAGFLFLQGCAQAPTKMYESKPVEAKVGEAGSVKVDDQTVILDARPAFQYAISHLNGSQNIQWSDFAQHEYPYYGELEKDLFFHARRLARLGIDPTTPVVVVGLGSGGHGEEGRVAWTLKVLGVKDVRFVNIDYFSMPLTSEEAPPRENKPVWKPQVDSSLVVDRKTIVKLLAHPRKADSPMIIDVRLHEEYLGKTPSSFGKSIPDISAMNIPWIEFFDSHGLIIPEMRKKLEAVGITPDRTLYVISEQGVESAGVTLALRQLGFAKAANFAGGYLELVESSSAK